MKHSDVKLGKILDNIPVAVAASTLALEQTVFFVNRQFVCLFGYTLEDMPTVKDWAIRAYPDAHYRSAFLGWWNAAVSDAVSRSGTVQSGEFQVTCDNGSVKDVLIGILAWNGCLLASFVDLCERKTAESALRQSEQRYRLLTENMLDTVWVLDLAANQLAYISPSCQAVYGYTAEELTANPADMILLPDDQKRVNALAQQRYRDFLAGAIGEQTYFTDEMACEHKDGSTSWVEEISHFMLNRDTGRVELQGVSRNIGVRKQAELALVESEARFRSYFELPLIGIAISSLDKTLLEVNDRACEIFGYSREELMHKTWGELTHPDDLTEDVAQYERALRGEIDRYSLEKRYIRADGQAVHVAISVACVRSGCAKPGYFIALIQDMTRQKQMDEALRDSEEKFRLAFHNANTGMCLVDMQGRLLEVNDKMSEIFGYSRGELQSMTVYDLAFPEDAALSRQFIDGAIGQRNDSTVFEKRYFHREGHVIDGEVVSSLVRDTHGNPLYFISQVQDITARKRAESEREQYFRLFSTASEMCILAPEGRFVQVNPAFEHALGYGKTELLSRLFMDFIHPEDRQSTREIVARVVDGVFAMNYENRCMRKDGAVLHLTWRAYFAQQENLIYAAAADITEKKLSEETIWRQANFDPLTGLPNRKMAGDRLAQGIKKSHRSGLSLALMFIDLDRFKEVNDFLGHNAGDALLRQVAQRIACCVRESDTVGRMGGDEFTVILGELHDIESVERVAAKLLEKLSIPFKLTAEDTAYIGASIGVAFYPQDAGDAVSLLKYADQAMYAAKRAGRNRCRYFTPVMRESVNARTRLSNDLHHALAEQQFVLFYQPIVNLPDGAVCKAEALLRWRHPKLGLLLPEAFIQLAEETSTIDKIGDWVFQEATAKLSLWRANLRPGLQIGINLSPSQFARSPSMQQAWLERMKAQSLPGAGIMAEVTENVLMEDRGGIGRQLRALKDYGIAIALDDFGTGHSSLSCLQKFDIDYIKIDQSLVRDLAHDRNDWALCEAIVVMAHKLGIQVIAEGVETQGQCDMFRQIGCEYGQGYLFAKPLPAEEFEPLIAGNR